MDINSPFYTLRRKVIFEHLEKFKDTPSKTLARILFRDYPGFFSSIEGARRAVRLYRGKAGEQARKEVKRNQFYTNGIQLA
jgi:hypothetical protein